MTTLVLDDLNHRLRRQLGLTETGTGNRPEPRPNGKTRQTPQPEDPPRRPADNPPPPGGLPEWPLDSPR